MFKPLKIWVMEKESLLLWKMAPRLMAMCWLEPMVFGLKSERCCITWEMVLEVLLPVVLQVAPSMTLKRES